MKTKQTRPPAKHSRSHRELHSIGLISKRNIAENPKHRQLIRHLVRYLKHYKKNIVIDNHVADVFPGKKGQKTEEILKTADLIITLGGDGTLLKTAHKVARHKALILAVNLGNLGFLTECTPDDLIPGLDRIFKGEFHTDRRSLLRITIYRSGRKIETHLALNDAVINQGAFARLISMDLEINSRKLVKFKADGMIIATPTGSTGHSLSAGGPIVHPQIEGLIVTPICPSSLSMRSILVPGSRQLTVTVETQRREEKDIIGLTIDGQDLTMLKFGDQIKFRRSKRLIYLIRLKNRYYKMLRQKLNWGEA